jgi:hypothetical protein
VSSSRRSGLDLNEVLRKPPWKLSIESTYENERLGPCTKVISLIKSGERDSTRWSVFCGDKREECRVLEIAARDDPLDPLFRSPSCSVYLRCRPGNSLTSILAITALARMLCVPFVLFVSKKRTNFWVHLSSPFVCDVLCRAKLCAPRLGVVGRITSVETLG